MKQLFIESQFKSRQDAGNSGEAHRDAHAEIAAVSLSEPPAGRNGGRL
jgi:hypothetical protein